MKKKRKEKKTDEIDAIRYDVMIVYLK